MVWRIETVRQVPTKTLEAWLVYDVLVDGLGAAWTRHFVGLRLEGYKAQVSSAVEVFDPVSRRAVTQSGQVYELGAGPGLNTDALHVWSRWLRAHHVRYAYDVTGEVEFLLRKHLQ